MDISNFNTIKNYFVLAINIAFLEKAKYFSNMKAYHISVGPSHEAYNGYNQNSSGGKPKGHLDLVTYGKLQV